MLQSTCIIREENPEHDAVFFSPSLFHYAASDRHHVATLLCILAAIAASPLLSSPEAQSRQLVIVVLVLDVVYG